MVSVIGAGFPRTGTSSMKAALERLGFGPCHHMFDILSNPDRADLWAPAAVGEPLDWERVFDGFRSCQDWPASFFWRELAQAYPEAKVVLTVRDPHAWYRSMAMLIANGPGRVMPESVPKEAAAIFQGMARLQPLLDHISRSVFQNEASFREGLPDEEEAVRAFHRHVNTVKESLPAERLLVFDVREGWEPLCRFLETDVPSEPFPHLNDAKTMQAMLERMMAGGPMANPFDRAP
jgi:hypothetical protein